MFFSKIKFPIAITILVGLSLAQESSSQGALQFDIVDSAVCKNECIDKNYHFCPTTEGTQGICCPAAERCEESSAYCSFDSSPDSTALKYWSCPHNIELCGTRHLTTSSGELVLQSNSEFESELVDGTICSYQISFP